MKMASLKISTGLMGAVAGMAMLLGAVAPSSAFTLAAPSPAQSVADPQIQHAWWDGWGRWHPNHPYWGWRRWGWGPPPPRVYGFYGPRRCWIGPWGHRHCAW